MHHLGKIRRALVYDGQEKCARRISFSVDAKKGLENRFKCVTKPLDPASMYSRAFLRVQRYTKV